MGKCRADTLRILFLAAEEEAEDRTAMRVVDLHPWIAEPAAPRLNTDRHSAAFQAAANLEVRWRERLGVDKAKFDNLIRSFDPTEQPPGIPALRFAAHKEGTADYFGAHEGAKLMAQGCVKCIRNLYAHRSDVPISPGYALELLGVLSLVARWVATAEVVPPKQRS